MDQYKCTIRKSNFVKDCNLCHRIESPIIPQYFISQDKVWTPQGIYYIFFRRHFYFLKP